MSILQKIVYGLTIAPRLYALRNILPFADIRPAGSRYVCNPPVLGTDIDFLVYCDDGAIDNLIIYGYIETKMKYGGSKPITCFRRGKVNVITTKDRDYFIAFEVATHLVKQFNLRNKLDRVALHEIVRGGEMFESYWWPSSEVKKAADYFRSPHRATLVRAYYAKHDLGS